jgi:hypothetical protein
MITREEYMENSKELHWAYYGQFVTDGIKNMVISKFGIENLVSSLKEDKYMNNIPLKKWDDLVNFLPSYVWAGLKNMGELNVKTLSNGVCILKAGARIAVEEFLKDKEENNTK